MKIVLSTSILLVGLAACQATPPQDPGATAATPQPDATRSLRPSASAPGSRVATAAQAKAAVARYVATLPNQQLYVTDSARVVEAGASYQVQVPRTDWAGRMPSRAAFEVDKATGSVSPRLVK